MQLILLQENWKLPKKKKVAKKKAKKKKK